ncbi:hypothetical protein FOTG_03038 [Fusarium oxysporum f. sp. vasinfectum 25433]|uniref:Uncharacterized protein n=1 Tax=Fusarium oxysporum f. sp. vasinfectum 25433 TaxID=1089449 RepID=X0M3Y2_FUSOX|nr:hypothetical protein FOTG_03038 [Fusarium oxysporum f. sp. vasinfectum 25433]
MTTSSGPATAGQYSYPCRAQDNTFVINIHVTIKQPENRHWCQQISEESMKLEGCTDSLPLSGPMRHHCCQQPRKARAATQFRPDYENTSQQGCIIRVDTISRSETFIPSLHGSFG